MLGLYKVSIPKIPWHRIGTFKSAKGLNVPHRLHFKYLLSFVLLYFMVYLIQQGFRRVRRLQSSKMRIVNATEFLQHKGIRALDFKALIADTY